MIGSDGVMNVEEGPNIDDVAKSDNDNNDRHSLL
jgi:hypothetical protein